MVDTNFFWNVTVLNKVSSRDLISICGKISKYSKVAKGCSLV